MRTVIVGLDFVHDSNGILRPIEINTNIGFTITRLEQNLNEVFDTTDLQNFINNSGFTKVTYIGWNVELKQKIVEITTSLSIEFENIFTGPSSITAPLVEDSETHLIIRQSYDTSAIVDESYCNNKVNFLDLIKNETFGSEFAYINSGGILVNTITNIVDNGIHPNFILKAKSPSYDREIYPKLYKVTNQSELNIILQNVTEEYFLMPYYFNVNKIHDNKITKIRKISLLIPPTLESIHFGAYTDVPPLKLSQSPTYDSQTFEIDGQYKKSYITKDYRIKLPKLLDNDYIIMADNTKKTGADLEVGDIIKTIDIPNINNANIKDELVNFGIDIDTFISGVTYSTNKVTRKEWVDVMSEIVIINFDDDTEWRDTKFSNYLIYRDNQIKFETLKNLVVGDIVVLIDTTDTNSVEITQKTVSSIELTNEIFSGWEITVERVHLFLTITGGNQSMVSFAAVEHNSFSCFTTRWGGFVGCSKGLCCDGGNCYPCTI